MKHNITFYINHH